jgi:hypothetical protein
MSIVDETRREHEDEDEPDLAAPETRAAGKWV